MQKMVPISVNNSRKQHSQQEFSRVWLLEHAVLSHPQKTGPSSPSTPSSLFYLQAYTSTSPALFILSLPILSPWYMLMIIPLLTLSPSDLPFLTVPPSDRLWQWKPKWQSEHTCKMSLGRRMERHTASCPAFGHNLLCPNTWKEKEG